MKEKSLDVDNHKNMVSNQKLKSQPSVWQLELKIID
jgi:hypothetical protein